MMTIARLLIANRGEIARRVTRTCHQLDIEVVAVHSDADADARYVRDADLRVRLPGTMAGETYLNREALLTAAQRAGADAIHPGYGFLSEDAAFAQAVIDAGLTWIGPPPAAIQAMGSKVEAKELMRQAGVPVLTQLAPEEVSDADLPVLVKADAGGGGRGMRIVRDRTLLEQEIRAAEREAGSAFGSSRVFCERYLDRGHHVEVQVLADAFGGIWTLGERDCSVQRRHQKVVEESPSPLLDADGRERMEAAARAAAAAIGYVGAGTVEFIMLPDGGFWFLEMNTRLQVEHPVTECVRGLDLVALQLRIAEGEPLPPNPPPAHGHAIEVRLYAEDPAAGWAPQQGVVERFDLVADRSFGTLDRPGIRLDSAIGAGDEITVHYDPMIAKVIAWAPTRDEAARRLSRCLRDAVLHGPTTNRDLLVRVLRHPAFLSGRMDTGYLERPEGEELLQPLLDGRQRALAATAAHLAAAERNRQAGELAAIDAGWRNVPSVPQARVYQSGDDLIEAHYVRTADGLSLPDHPDVEVVACRPSEVVLQIAGVQSAWRVHQVGPQAFVDTPFGSVTLQEKPRFEDPDEQHAAGSLVAPLPGTVIDVLVAVGDEVAVGQPLVILEAMKMQHTISAPADGVVTGLEVTIADQVVAGALLALVTETGELPT